MSRFIHIADLHHARHLDTTIFAEHSSFDVQRTKLTQLAAVIRSEHIKAVLIAGDIEVSDPNDFLPYLSEWTDLGASVYIVFGDHDINREAYKASWETVDRVYCFLDPGYIYDERLGAGIYGLSCQTRRNGLTTSFLSVPPRSDDYPNVFLSHGNRNDFPVATVASLGYDYFALGHLHRHKEPFTRGGIPFVYPGQVFSVWDGSGKSWTTGYVIGTISKDGVSHAFCPFQGPETRRISFNRFIKKEHHIQMTLDNIADRHSYWVEDDEYVTRSIVRNLLSRYPEDYFVTPSDRNRKPTRICMTGQTLLREVSHFEDYYHRLFKATAKTQ